MRPSGLFRSPPELAQGLTKARHAGAILLTMLTCWVLGMGFLGLSELMQSLLPAFAAVLLVLGYLWVFAPTLSLLGHLPMAVVLHMLLRRGRAGWIFVALAGLVIGAICSAVLSWPFILPFGPILALVQAGLLRLILIRASNAPER